MIELEALEKRRLDQVRPKRDHIINSGLAIKKGTVAALINDAAII